METGKGGPAVGVRVRVTFLDKTEFRAEAILFSGCFCLCSPLADPAAFFFASGIDDVPQ